MLTLLGCSLESREQCPSVSPYSQIINKKWMQSILLRGWSSHECREIVMPLQEFFKKNMISHISISWMKSLNNTQLLNFRRKEKLMIASVFQFILQRLIHFDFFHSNLRVTFSYLFYFSVLVEAMSVFSHVRRYWMQNISKKQLPTWFSKQTPHRETPPQV